MSRRARGGGAPRRSEAHDASPPAGVTASHPAMIAALVVVAACVLVSVTFTIFETDFWHHLLVGRVIWERHAVPTTQLWSWPTWGAPEANSAWLFRALVWPFWSIGGVTGLFAWRWITTLATFAVVWATARRTGARGFAPLVALVLCVFIERLRSQVRPETLVAVLLALEVWLLESRRRGGRDRTLWLVPLLWVWVNVHLSYTLGFLVLAVYLGEAWLAGRATRTPRPEGGPDARRLAIVAGAALVVSLANPFGWRALWEPFDFFLNNRQELMYRTIKELKPVDWRLYARSVLPLIVGGWTLLVLWRAWHRRIDRVEIALCATFTAIALSTQRFIGYYAVVAAPFLMRDLAEWVAARRWPAWSASPWARAALTGAVCIAAGLREWDRPDMPLGIGIQWDKYPVRACDFIADNGIRGRGFNNFEYGGYQAWRFWPDRERLPFMTGTPEAASRTDRFLYAGVFARPEVWGALDRRHRFDYVLLERLQEGDNHLLDVLDADTTWTLVFADDAGVVYVRRSGPLRALAERHRGDVVPAGAARLATLGAAMTADTSLAARVEAELRARAAASPWNARDLALLADIALAGGRPAEARELVGRALTVSPTLMRGHERLGLVALAEGRPRDAIAEFERERRLYPRTPGNAMHEGQAWRRLGDLGRAREAYRRELRLDPGNAEANDSLAAVERASGT